MQDAGGSSSSCCCCVQSNRSVTFQTSIKLQILYIKKLQAIHLMLYKRSRKTAKIKKYKYEHYALA